MMSSSSSPLSDSNPKLHQSIISMTEDAKNRLCRGLDIKRVFPNRLKTFCSCADCDEKINDLLDFDNDVIFLHKLIHDHVVELEKKESLCLSLYCASHWNVLTLDFLYNKLKSISEDSGIPLALEKSLKLENAFKQLTRYLIDAKFIPDDHLSPCSVELDDDIFEHIDSGCNSYGETKAKGEALPLLEEMRKITHEASEKSATSILDVSFYTNYFVQLIQCLEKMPVDGMQAEVEDLVKQICPVAEHTNISMEARKYIRDTCVSMIHKSCQLWNFESQEHSSNGLDKMLDSLLIKVDLFKRGWEKDYGHVFTSFDRSNPKRRRIE